MRHNNRTIPLGQMTVKLTLEQVEIEVAVSGSYYKGSTPSAGPDPSELDTSIEGIKIEGVALTPELEAVFERYIDKVDLDEKITEQVADLRYGE